METEKNASCVITLEPIEVQTHSAPQNGCLNLSFVKDNYVGGGKVARNGRNLQFSCLKFCRPVSIQRFVSSIGNIEKAM